ncbi:unnamed protein product [Meloidogyne enterolobii]|uniref:Uncharacterized protein n=1 Tax=Meloidogyne enterolobii TaxID=390850 RepID=A0ACB0YC78_MELEN
MLKLFLIFFVVNTIILTPFSCICYIVVSLILVYLIFIFLKIFFIKFSFVKHFAFFFVCILFSNF